MKSKLQTQNFSLKFFTPLFLIVCYWFYLNICFGFFLSKIFYNFFDTINKSSFYKTIKFRKKFSFKNIIKTVSEFFWKLIKNWFIRIGQKFLLLMDAIDQVIKALKIFRKKFKSIFKFKYNFRLLKNLLPIFWETFLIYCSLVKEILFLPNLFYWLIEWRNFIQLLMKESVFITRIVYVLYMIILGLFGVLLGFFLGVYRRKDDIYVFTLLFLLELIYNNGLDYVLLEPNKAEPFSKFSLKTIEQINPRPSKLFLGELVEKPQIPFPLLEDPSISIDIDFLFEESTNYEFELFRFYRNVNQKVKS